MRALRIAGMLVITISLSACGSSHDASPPTLQSLRSSLAHDHYLHWHAVPASPGLAVSKRRAERVAAGRGTQSGLSATLVRVTNTAYCRHSPDGSCHLLIKNRLVWIVLIPNQSVPYTGPRGGGPSSYTATLAVLIDANTGKYLQAAAVPAH